MDTPIHMPSPLTSPSSCEQHAALTPSPPPPKQATLEVIWTIIPTFIVLAIAVPSLTLIYSLDQHTDRPGERVCKQLAQQWKGGRVAPGGTLCVLTLTSGLLAWPRQYAEGGCVA